MGMQLVRSQLSGNDWNDVAEHEISDEDSNVLSPAVLKFDKSPKRA